MAHRSVAHDPGAMWRYLGFNLPCEYVYFQDTDRAFTAHSPERFLPVMREHRRLALARSVQWSSPGHEMALILGNDFLIRPGHIGFDARRTMLGYIVLHILHEDRINNFVHEPLRCRTDTAIAPVSKRFAREHFGPLPHERVPNKNYPYYGFDEQWLKEFVYYALSDGRMATLLKFEKPEDEIQRLDLSHQRQHGNVLVSG
jgi:hypothetical protein